MLTDARTIKSNAFFRFTVIAKADVLSTPTNIQQQRYQSRTNWQKGSRNLQPTLAHILNGRVGNMTEMTRCHNKVVGVISRVIDE
jgi:hypothetical protein